MTTSRPTWMNRQYSGSSASPERRDADIVALVFSLDERVQQIMREKYLLAERVAALEERLEPPGTIRHTVTFRDDAPPEAVLIPADTRPAWQRAKVGDRVEHQFRGRCEVVGINEDRDERGGRLMVKALGDTEAWTSYDEYILSILPPEPERPKDETASDIGIPISGLDALKAEATDALGPLWRAIGAWYLAGITAPTKQAVDEHIRSIADEAHALGLSERVQTETDVRERAVAVIRETAQQGESHEMMARRLSERGLLASAQQPQRVTLEQCAKLYLEISDAPPEKGGVHIAVEALRRAIPGIVIEGEP
jgi:hypothetical protein